MGVRVIGETLQHHGDPHEAMEQHTSRAAVIAAEQRAVDNAYKHFERTVRQSSDPHAALAASNTKARTAVRRDLEARAASLKLNGRPLVVMRADVEDGSRVEPHYIGRANVFDEDYVQVVFSWSAPETTEWRLSTASDPGRVRLLRRLDCDGNKVKGYLDLHGFEPRGHRTGRHLGKAVRPPSAKELAEPVVQELEAPRSGQMHDVVETIQREQLLLVVKSPDETMIVQGGPGSGKTVVGVHRVAWLLDNKHIEPRDLLVLGPSRRFLRYIETALTDLGAATVALSDFESFWGDGEALADPTSVAAVKGSLSMVDVLRQAIENRVDQWPDRLAKLIKGDAFTFKLEGRTASVPVRHISDIAAEELSGDRPYRIKRERCRRRLIERAVEAYTTAMTFVSRDYYKQIAGLSGIKRIINALCPSISARDLLGEVLTKRKALAKAAAGILDSEQQQELLAQGMTDEPSQEDLVCLDELQWLLSGDTDGRYKHLVVDEAQDLTPMQARYLRRRCSGSMTVLGDIAQATGPVHYDDWEDIADILAGGRSLAVEELGTSFRTPKAVLDFTAELREACAPGINAPTAIREAEKAVFVKHTTMPAGLAAKKAASLAADDDEEPRRSVAVIVPETGIWRKRLASELRRATSDDRGSDARADEITVLTPIESKGLEFDHVILVEPAAIDDGTPAGHRALHIAATRSTQSLTIVHWSPLPESFGGPPNAAVTPPGVPIAAEFPQLSGSGHMQKCTRYHADGRKCVNQTDSPDGWCRQEPCGGYRSAGIHRGSIKHLNSSYREGRPRRYSGGHALRQVARISSGARHAFIRHHGGTESEAFSEMQWMLRVFKEHATHHRDGNREWHLDLDGYRLTLKPDGGTITGYATTHTEVSFAQRAFGVPVRAKAVDRAARRSRMTPPPRTGTGSHEPAFTPEQFARSMSAASLHITAEACAAFERLDRSGMAYFGEDFQAGLVAKLDSDASTAPAWKYSESEIEIYGERLTWRIAILSHSLVDIELTEAVDSIDDLAEPDLEAVPAEPGTAYRADGLDGLAKMLEARARPVREDHEWRRLRDALRTHLTESGAEVGVDPYADLWCARDDGLTMFKVVAKGKNDYRRLRANGLHLLEAATVQPTRPDRLVIVLGERPREPWAANALDAALGISLAWLAEGSWVGLDFLGGVEGEPPQQ